MSAPTTMATTSHYLAALLVHVVIATFASGAVLTKRGSAGVATQCDQSALETCAAMIVSIHDQQKPDKAMICKKVYPVLECFANLRTSCPQLKDYLDLMDAQLAYYKTMCGDGADDICSLLKMDECTQNMQGQLQELGDFDRASHCPVMREFMMCVKPMESCTGEIQQTLQLLYSYMPQSLCAESDAESSPEYEVAVATVDNSTSLTRRGAGNIRLVGGDGKTYGTVVVTYGDLEGPICDDSWDFRDAYVACRMLGFKGALQATTGNYYNYPDLGDNFVLDNLLCNTSEDDIFQCQRDGTGAEGIGRHNCVHSEEAGLVCYAP